MQNFNFVFSEITDEICITDSSSQKIEVEANQIYFGTATNTRRGVECVNWSSISNSQQSDDHNYCRNDGTESAPWCYTKSVREGDYWDYCSCVDKGSI